MNKRKTILWSLIVGASLYLSYDTLVVKGINPEVNKCGILMRKESPTVLDVHKHSADVRIEDKFVMKFEDGTWENIQVNPKTWNGFEVGDRLCFNRPVNLGFGHQLSGMYSIFFLFILFVIVCIWVFNRLFYLYVTFIDPKAADYFKD